jgi:hypothetical protein
MCGVRHHDANIWSVMHYVAAGGQTEVMSDARDGGCLMHQIISQTVKKRIKNEAAMCASGVRSVHCELN